MKSKLGIIFDSLFISFIVFLIIYFWLLKFIKNAFLCLMLSISLSFVVFFIIYRYSIKKFKLNKLTLEDQKLAKNSMYKLKFMDNKSLIKYFETLLEASHIKGNIYKKGNLIFYVCTKRSLLEEDFIEAYDYAAQNENNFELSFIALKISEEFLKLSSIAPEKSNIFSETELFLLMKEKCFYPDEANVNQNKPNKLNTLKSKISSGLTRSHFKEFFFSGLSLILISVVIPFSLYYLIFGSGLLLLSIISLFFKNKNKVVSTEKNLCSLIKDATQR